MAIAEMYTDKRSNQHIDFTVKTLIDSVTVYAHRKSRVTFATKNVKYLIIVSVMGLTLFGCSKYPSKEIVKDASQRIDPQSFDLQQGWPPYVKYGLTNNPPIQFGTITLKDGSNANFWFLSHHVGKDVGATLFKMSDGTERYVVGGFCCEVGMPKNQPNDFTELTKYLNTRDGLEP